MKVLFDEMMPRQLRRDLVGHTVSTVTQAGWKGLKNGALLAEAEKQFDAFISMDANLPFHQKLQAFRLGFVIIHAANNTLEALRPMAPEILRALNHVRPGQVVHVPEQTS
jgi:hypothetical protein